MTTQTPAAKEAAKQAHAALAALRNLPGLEEVLEGLRLAQHATETADIWDTELGRETESAMGHLRMALEAAGKRF